MKTYIAMLRGINVSGKNLIKMNDLREIFAKLGLTNVSTYIQSGNVIFTSPETATEELAQNIAAKITAGFGFNVPVIVLNAVEFENIYENNPLNDGIREPGFLHITFLSATPAGFDIKAIEQKKQKGEEIAISGNACYLFCPNGYGNTKLTNTFLESKLKVTATTRNWKTVNELLRIAQKKELPAVS
jgi:uncharacterized protein (DUF1697 family)